MSNTFLEVYPILNKENTAELQKNINETPKLLYKYSDIFFLFLVLFEIGSVIKILYEFISVGDAISNCL